MIGGFIAFLFAAVFSFATGGPIRERATSAAAAQACPPITSGILPGWARGGFSEKRPRVPFVSGRNGEIIGIIFKRPLVSPAPVGENEKILWVSHSVGASGAPLRITGRELASGRTMSADVTVGPSSVDVPVPGCWRFDLRWPGHHHDTMVVPYSAPVHY